MKPKADRAGQFSIKKHLLFVSLVLSVLHVPTKAGAQFNDAHSYDNTPIGTNEIELSYAYVHSNTSLDTSLVIAGAKLDVNQGAVIYTRYFGLANHTMWVNAGLPFAGLSGSVAGTNISGSVSGVADSSYQVAALVKGGPALAAPQFENYRPTMILGVSFTLIAPTGLYDANKILNLGSDRWTLKPEFALVQPFGPEQKWQFDAYANVYVYTDNTSYRGREILRQEPLPGFEGHVSYSFNDRLWTSLDTRYSTRATTFVNGVDQKNAQQNFIVGAEMNVSLNSRNSLLFEFAKALLHQNGPALVGFRVRYAYTWGKGYR